MKRTLFTIPIALALLGAGGIRAAAADTSPPPTTAG